MEFDFENESENCICEKVVKKPEVEGIRLEPILGMLSVYFHFDDKMNHDYVK